MQQKPIFFSGSEIIQDHPYSFVYLLSNLHKYFSTEHYNNPSKWFMLDYVEVEIRISSILTQYVDHVDSSTILIVHEVDRQNTPY